MIIRSLFVCSMFCLCGGGNGCDDTGVVVSGCFVCVDIFKTRLYASRINSFGNRSRGDMH